MESNYLHADLTSKILKAYFKVYNTLGHGFLEKVYEEAMMIELRRMGMRCAQQKYLEVFYEGEKVGVYVPDIIVEDLVIVELKAAEFLCAIHSAQLINYLRASNIEVGLLLNFGKTPQHQRRVVTAPYKKNQISPAP